MNIEPYIGITDFMTFEQVQKMLAIFKANKRAESKRRLHVGVMMSYKTLNDLPSKFKGVFPKNEDIANIFGLDETFNCLHYADYHDEPDLANSLTKAIGFGGTGIHALQLDMCWPEPADIANAIHMSRKKIEVILQIGRNALEDIDNDPAQLVDRLHDYDTVVQRVLFDKSMGRGLGMDAEELLPFARAIKRNLPEMGLVAAGGLGPNTMHLVEPFLEEFPDISIDAQGQLRPSGSNLDPIDWVLAEKYLVRSLQLLD